MKIIPFLFLILALLYSCDEKSKSTTTDPSTPGLRDTIGIAYGNEISIPGEMLSLKFVDVQESRCPKNANCIRAGEAIASLMLTKDSNTHDLKLEAKGLCEDTTGKCGESKKAAGYNIQLIDISPYPAANSAEKGKNNYRIRVVVDKSQS